MQATRMGYIGIIRYILGLYRDNGKENGDYYIHNGVYIGFELDPCGCRDAMSRIHICARAAGCARRSFSSFAGHTGKR